MERFCADPAVVRVGTNDVPTLQLRNARSDPLPGAGEGAKNTTPTQSPSPSLERADRLVSCPTGTRDKTTPRPV